jgi:hypothetical protein
VQRRGWAADQLRGGDADLEIGAGTSDTPYFLSATPGKICEAGDLAAGMKMIFVGTGKAGEKLNFKPVAGGTVPEA